MASIKNVFITIDNHICRFQDKFVNTLIWFFTPKSKTVVFKGWTRHRGKHVHAINFGDDINYIIISYLSGKSVINVKCSYISIFKPTNYLCIGSIVDYMTDKQSIIWGAGAIGYQGEMRDRPIKVCAVRGPKTRDYLLKQGIECPQIYGDPALLFPLIYKCSQKKRYKIGLIPHIVDLDNPRVIDFKTRLGEDCVVIDFADYTDWKGVIDTINQCDIVASSSLHGLIISDAYGIPNVWIKLSDKIIGESFKYQDYFLGVGRSCNDPICFVGGEIDYEKIKKQASQWESVRFDADKLLNSCPFYCSHKQ